MIFHPRLRDRALQSFQLRCCLDQTLRLSSTIERVQPAVLRVNQEDVRGSVCILLGSKVPRVESRRLRDLHIHCL